MHENTVRILGVTVANLSMPEAIKTLDSMISNPERRTHAVSIVNAHTLNLACESSDYLAALNDSDLVLGDGTGVRIAARQRGVEMLDNLVGTDLLPAFFAETRHFGRSMFLLGGTEEAASRAAAYCSDNFPGWTVAGWHHGYVDDAQADIVISTINKAVPDLLMVAMGNPLQETWIYKFKDRLRVPVCVGVGGLFDHWAGTLQRAPVWVRRLGIEWMQILIQQPHKWRRYLIGNFAFLVRVRRQLTADTDVDIRPLENG